jgi:TonB family protein
MRKSLVTLAMISLAGCASHTQQPVQAEPPATWSAEGIVDIRGIWDDTGVTPEGAARLGIDPAEIVAPVKTKHVHPEYPDFALRARIQGDVLLHCVIGVDGRSRDCRVHQSVSPDLDSAALRAVGFWRYEPLRVAGQPRPALVELLVSFALS